MADATTIAGPEPKHGIAEIHPYVGGASKVEGVDRVVKLSSNENPYGCSPKALEAYQRASAERGLTLYPDGGWVELRAGIADVYDLDPARIACGAGSDELLQLLTRAYAGPGDEVLFTQYSFEVYRLAARQVGANPVAAAEEGLTANVDELIAHVTANTRIVFLANPNNPTGSWVGRQAIARLHAALPSHVLLVLDGAYAEYMDEPDYEDGFALARTAPNVVVTRTFSKIHGLASLRVGWAYGPKAIIDTIHRVRGPFNVSGPAQKAALAALADADFADVCKTKNAEGRAALEHAAQTHGVLAVRGAGNFALLRFPDAPGRSAEDADAFLKARGLIVRRPLGVGLGDCLRITIGTDEDNTAVIAALDAFMGAG